ncbi:hypothetical protein AB1Y20_012153 [Prymnesium parvum]|uniref:Sodium/calcium exchanger membrane region domain-containing protein n=1 Tax=Prymnesium parvum TaxID=97485 RepID=A0AB34IR95_PRYPA
MADSALHEALLVDDEPVHKPSGFFQVPRPFRRRVFLLIPPSMLAPLLGMLNLLPDLYNFSMNLAALAPLALMLATLTDELGKHVGQVFAALINATMGNAVELIISIQALRAGLLRLLQLQLLGSILANAVLLTGFCFWAGGIAHHTQHFHKKTVFATSSALLVAVLALCIPTAYTMTLHHPADCLVRCVAPEVLSTSRGGSILLLCCYAVHVYWSTVTHPAPLCMHSPGRIPHMSLTTTIALTAATTVWIAMCSDQLFGDTNGDNVRAIEGAATELGVSPTFVALILLPNVGNAAESLSAISIAYRGRMDMALGTALGSALQLAVGIVPVLVLICWTVDIPLSLDFHLFETVVLLLSALVVNSIVRQAESTYLEGVLLVTSYLIIAVAFKYRSTKADFVVMLKPCDHVCPDWEAAQSDPGLG